MKEQETVSLVEVVFKVGGRGGDKEKAEKKKSIVWEKNGVATFVVKSEEQEVEEWGKEEEEKKHKNLAGRVVTQGEGGLAWWVEKDRATPIANSPEL